MAQSYVARQMVTLPRPADPAQGLRHGQRQCHPRRPQPARSPTRPELESRLNQIPGVVTVGIFAQRPADVILMAEDAGVKRSTALMDRFASCGWRKPPARAGPSEGPHGLAGGLGFEPRLTESESAVLPLDDPPTMRRMHGGARAAAAADQRFEYWVARRALRRPTFLRSTSRASRVTKPALRRAPRRLSS